MSAEAVTLQVRSVPQHRSSVRNEVFARPVNRGGAATPAKK
jgi:hypothetical protein